MLSWLYIFHLAICTTQGIKALSENKVTDLTHRSLVSPCHSFLIFFSIFLHSLTSSILRISLDSAEAGPRHENIQPWHIPFPTGNQSVVPCPDLTVASWPAYRFFRTQVRWSGIPISLRIFHRFSGTLLLFWWSKACRQFDFWFLCLF